MNGNWDALGALRAASGHSAPACQRTLAGLRAHGFDIMRIQPGSPTTDARIAYGLIAMLERADNHPALTLGEDEVVHALLEQLRNEGLASFTAAQAEETVRLATKAGVFGDAP